MFTKNEDKKSSPVTPMAKPATTQPPAAPPAPPVPQATVTRAAPAPTPITTTNPNAPSIISADLTITGTLVTERDVQIDGRIEGDIRAASLTLGEKALVQGDIYAEEAIIRGRVEGSIRARKVQLTGTAHVEGNIVHDRQLSVDTGAYFEGSCKHSDNPIADAPEALRAKPRQGLSTGNGSPAASFTSLNA